MAITIEGYKFEGPFPSTDDLKNQSGVYAIYDKRTNGKYYLLDVGESREVKNRVEDHDRSDCWEKHRKGTLYYAVYYADKLSRELIEHVIREKRPDIPCGER